MSLERKLNANYLRACKDAENGCGDDQRMIELIGTIRATANYTLSFCDILLVRCWMTDYGVMKHLRNDYKKRCDTGAAALNFFSNGAIYSDAVAISDDIVESNFSGLLNKFYDISEPYALSGTSKVLWCAFPHHFIIFDRYAEAAAEDLLNFNRITSREYKSRNAAVKYYMDYYTTVRGAFDKLRPKFAELRKLYGQDYPYDIRVLDKMLWEHGKPIVIKEDRKWKKF